MAVPNFASGGPVSGASNVTPPAQPAPTPDPYGGETVTLVPGRLRGYRSWRATWPQIWVTPVWNDEDPYLLPATVRLSGITAPVNWQADSPPAAVCHRAELIRARKYQRRGGFIEHPTGAPVPAPGCSCGYYALHCPADYQLGLNGCTCYTCTRDHSAVSGVVEGWGRVEIGSNGWRAEYARIAAICLPPPWLPEGHAGPQPPDPVARYRRITESGDRLRERIYREKWHAVDRTFSVPIFGTWLELVQAFPPMSLAALRRAKQAEQAAERGDQAA